MALVVRVMPLTRYFLGAAAADAAAARRRVQRLRTLVTRAAGRPTAWRDEGETVLEEQLATGSLDALRAFAADQDRPAPRFAFADNPLAHPGLLEIFRGARTRYAHLIRVGEAGGLYVPCDFPEPLAADEQGLPVGSGVALLRELNMLAGPLRMRLDQGDAGWTDQFERDDALAQPRMAWALLRWCVRLGVQHRLPVILDG